MAFFNVQNNKRCAFCKYWYDPVNAHIRPKFPSSGIWEWDENVESICQKTGWKRYSNMMCQDYICKIPF